MISFQIVSSLVSMATLPRKAAHAHLVRVGVRVRVRVRVMVRVRVSVRARVRAKAKVRVRVRARPPTRTCCRGWCPYLPYISHVSPLYLAHLLPRMVPMRLVAALA